MEAIDMAENAAKLELLQAMVDLLKEIRDDIRYLANKERNKSKAMPPFLGKDDK
ncbi:MAG: hypothetical protein ACHQF3_00125 [Alphaproteobacteria bacterium]